MSATAVINRENAQHSTGPRTEEGKSAIRFNAVKHGLYAKTILLSEEDAPAFRALGEHLRARYAPVTRQETDLVDVLHETRWRLDHLTSVEHSLYALGAREHIDAVVAEFGELDTAAARSYARVLGYQANAKLFDQLSRHERGLRRLFEKTTKDLEQLIAARQPASLPTSMPAAPPAALGFVPAKTAPPIPTGPDGAPIFTGPMADIKRKQWLRRQKTLRGV